MNPFAKFPQAPYDAVMPSDWQMVFTIILGILAAVFWVYAINIYRKEGELGPIFIMLGGTICIFAEPIVDVVGSVWFPAHGQWVAIETFGRPIPLMVGLAYMWFYGGMIILTIRRFERGMTLKQVWQWYILMCVVEFCLEPIPINLGLWMYYGKQPFRMFDFPLWWPLVNTVGMFSASFMIFKVRPYLKGAMLPLIIFLVPSGDLAGNAFTAWPIWNALHTTQGYGVTYLAGILTLGLCAVAVQIIARVISERSDKTG